MTIKKIQLIAGVLVFLSVVAGVASADDNNMLKLTPGQPIVVDGDKVEFFEKEKRIVAEGNVSIVYGEVTLTCDRIDVDTVSQKAICTGNVHVEHPEGVLTGYKIIYDFPNKKGEILEAEIKHPEGTIKSEHVEYDFEGKLGKLEDVEVEAYPWFAEAGETARVSESEYVLKNGMITTCDHDSPHYRIQAGEIKIYPDEKVVAKNAVFYIGEVPVMWVPYYYHPIIQTKAKVQFIPGQSSEWGYFLLSAWRFYIKGNTKVDILVDYRTKKGFAEGANLYYFADDLGLRGLGKGVLRAYFIQQNDIGTYDPTSFRDEDIAPKLRQKIQWNHRIDFDENTVGMVEFNKYSDKYLMKDYFYNEFEENDPVPPNYFSITTIQPNFMFSLEVAKRFNNFYTVIEKLPELKLDVPNQRLWDTKFYYKSESSGTIFDKEYEFESSPPEKVARGDTFHTLSYVSKIGFLNLTPYGTIRESVYSRHRWNDHFISRAAFGGGVNAFTRFHRILDFDTDFMGLDINDIRHIIVPSAEYFHLHQPTV
jgi:lipopolysaccharide assembly outer membrane protein LptD (OstA)